MKITCKSEAHFYDYTKRKPTAVVLFTTQVCGPCAVVKELFDNETIDVMIVDAEKFSKLTNHFTIMSVPTTLYFENGKIQKMYQGYSADLREFIESTRNDA